MCLQERAATKQEGHERRRNEFTKQSCPAYVNLVAAHQGDPVMQLIEGLLGATELILVGVSAIRAQQRKHASALPDCLPITHNFEFKDQQRSVSTDTYYHFLLTELVTPQAAETCAQLLSWQTLKDAEKLDEVGRRA